MNISINMENRELKSVFWVLPILALAINLFLLYHALLPL